MKTADVEEYLSLHATTALAEKRMGELRETLLPQLRAGEPSPPGLPYLLELRTQERANKDYKTPLLARLVSLFGKKLGERKLELIEAKFEKVTIEQLHVVANKHQLAQPALEALQAGAA